MKTYFGKHRGVVLDNVDPAGQGRLQVAVASVSGAAQRWALPCIPFIGQGIWQFVLPPVGSTVWIEFEQGDPDSPIWTGRSWGPGEFPAGPTLDGVAVLNTDVATITIDERRQGVIIETIGGAKLSLTADGVELTNRSASITLRGPTVSVNHGALEVT